MFKKVLTKKNLKKRLPILSWLPVYSAADLLGDCIAGLTVGLTVIPQGIAYAIIAGLPPNYGLYSAFIGCFFYVIFGSCKDITIGPTAIMSILTAEYAHGDPEMAIFLCFTSAIIILLFGILNLGFLIAFVSKPVISGFTSAAAITIASSQLKGLFGISIHAEGLIQTWIEVGKHITETRWQDLTLGLSCIFILLFMRKMKDFAAFKRTPEDTSCQKVFKMAGFLTSVGRNAIVVVFATILAAALNENQPFIITGYIKPGLPEFSLPPFSMNNGTTTFVDMVSKVGSGIIILPLISILENIAIGSAFSLGKTIDATQEMIALGICNLAGSFVQSMPTTGSFSRTAVNATSGVRTPAGGTVTGALVVLALAVLTPYFQFIPKSALAAVIICAVIFSIEYHEIVPIYRVRKVDEVVLWTTFLICCFWKLEYGIVIGVIVNLCIVLYSEGTPKMATPSLQCPDGFPPHVQVTPRTGLLFLNVDKVRNFITKAGIKTAQGTYPVVVDCQHFTTVDFSAATGMLSLCADFKKRNQAIVFTNASPGVKKSLSSINPEIIIEDYEDLKGALMSTIHTIKKQLRPPADDDDHLNYDLKMVHRRRSSFYEHPFLRRDVEKADSESDKLSNSRDDVRTKL